MKNKTATENGLPSCCSKGDTFDEHFTPQAHSSFIEAEEASSLSDEDLEENDNSFSTTLRSHRSSIDRYKTSGATVENVLACCKNKTKPIERKILDSTVTTAPIPGPRGGTYSASKSFASSFSDKYHTPSGRTYDVSANYTNSGFGTFTNTEASSYNDSYHQRTHVPRPSRNYHTYESNQPKYFSTPMPSTTRRWSQNLSSINDTRISSPAQDTFNVSKQSRMLPRNVRMVPRINRLYANPNVNSDIQKAYTYNYIQNPNVSPYKQALGKTFSAQPRTPSRAYQVPQAESPYARLADPNMSDFIRRPQTSPMQSPQRRYPPTSTPYERPHSAAVTGDNELPACCRTGANRPKTAEASVEKGAGCWDNHCGKSSGPKEAESFCNDNTCSKQQLVNNDTQTCAPRTNVGCQSEDSKPEKCGGGCDQSDEEQPLDTLLEIRTPHRPPGGSMGMPFVLSINVSCADRSVVITPDKGYKAISSNTPSQN